MRFLFVVLALIVVPTTVRADDIKDYVQYQRERLRTYADAVDYFEKTKKPTIIWVNLADDDELFEAWQSTRSQGFHVFVKTFPATAKGVVVGGDHKGVYAQLGVFPWSKTILTDIRDALIVKKAEPLNIPLLQWPQSSCPNGRCPTPR